VLVDEERVHREAGLQHLDVAADAAGDAADQDLLAAAADRVDAAAARCCSARR
jgi:hypothetical protein